jgi:hypothetical protein
VACHWAEQIKAGEIKPKRIEPVFELAHGPQATFEAPSM